MATMQAGGVTFLDFSGYALALNTRGSYTKLFKLISKLIICLIFGDTNVVVVAIITCVVIVASIITAVVTYSGMLYIPNPNKKMRIRFNFECWCSTFFDLLFNCHLISSELNFRNRMNQRAVENEST